MTSPTTRRAASRAPRGRSRAARAGALIASLACSLALAGQASAALTAVGPVVPRHGFPEFYQDSTGLKLGLCVENTDPFCTATAPNPTPAMVSANAAQTNFPGETFYWMAQANIDRPIGTRATLVLAQEATFVSGDPVAGEQITFGRIRVRVDGLVPGAAYTVTEPYGTHHFTANAAGFLNETIQVGCAAAPCPFDAALGTGIGPFLRWDPAVAPAAPAGFVGNPLVAHRVVGSPTGNNLFRVVGPSAGGPGVSTISTNLFTVEGKLAGPPTPFLEVQPRDGVAFGGQTDLTQGAPRPVTVTNGGTAPMTVSGFAMAGAASDFPVVANGCAGQTLASGASCTVMVAFRPAATGARAATIAVATNATGMPNTVALGGTGVAPAAPPKPAPLKLLHVRLRAALTLAQAHRDGITLRVTVPAGAHVVRVRVFKLAHHKRRLVAQRLFKVKPGARVLHLNGRALRARLTRGRYLIAATPGASRKALGATTRRHLLIL